MSTIDDQRSTDVIRVDHPSPWRGDELQAKPEEWLCHLEDNQIAELTAVVDQLPSDRGDWPDIEHVALSGALTATIAGWRDKVKSGHGLVLVRGMPVRQLGAERAAMIFWLIGLHFGEPISQNGAKQTLVDIRDDGANAADRSTRLYRTRSELTFHTDGADIIGLLCLRGAKAGGVSRIASSSYVFNEVVERRPGLIDLLFEEWHHHAHGQNGPSGPPTFRYPIAVARMGNSDCSCLSGTSATLLSISRKSLRCQRNRTSSCRCWN